jgi:hypothetical protein
MKKIDADLTSKIDISRSCALSAEELGRSCPKDRVALPKHAECAERTGLRRLIVILDRIDLDLRISLNDGLQRVLATSDAEIRRRFVGQRFAEIDRNG